MQDPLSLWSSTRGLDKTYGFLTAGRHYRVIQLFIDFDKCVHLPGEQWQFVGASFLPYDDGTSFFVSINGIDGLQIRLQGAPEEQGAILRHLGTYLAPIPSETFLAPSHSFVALLKHLSDVMQARQHRAIDELFFAAEQDLQMAALVRSWYRQWVDENSLLAPWVLPRHTQFAAFINSAV